jgi:hypothetical protein
MGLYSAERGFSRINHPRDHLDNAVIQSHPGKRQESGACSYVCAAAIIYNYLADPNFQAFFVKFPLLYDILVFLEHPEVPTFDQPHSDQQ